MRNPMIEKISSTPIRHTGRARPKETVEFSKIVKGAIHRIDKLEKDSNQSVVDLLQGKTDVHKTMISMQKADMSMRLLLTIRNKVIDAYREIMRMGF